MKKITIIVLSLFFSQLILAQKSRVDSLTQDSIKRDKANRSHIYKGPKKATIMSAILPGLGQVYNKKYWKVPIVYAGMGSFIYLFAVNNEQFNFYRNNLLSQVKDPSLTFVGGLTLENNQKEKFRYKKYRDFSAIGIAAFYLLNIIDANVDGHLKTFDVSDDLSLRLSPFMERPVFIGSENKICAGFSLKLNFKK
jgi:hypothetical protein